VRCCSRPNPRAYLEDLRQRVDVIARTLEDSQSRSQVEITPISIYRSMSSAATTNRTPQPEKESNEPNLFSTEILLPMNEDEIFDQTFFANPSDDTQIRGNAESPGKKLFDDLLLTTTTGGMRLDRSMGQWRYFGPTTNFHHISSDTHVPAIHSPRGVRQAHRILSGLSPETHDHLLEAYWMYYNSFYRIVDQDAFVEDKEIGGTQYYSAFLHVTMLAVGFRSADKRRLDIQKLQLVGTRESILHREAKYLSEYELECPGGVPSIQALLLLSSLESGSGRDNVGWMYAGMDTFSINHRYPFC